MLALSSMPGYATVLRRWIPMSKCLLALFVAIVSVPCGAQTLYRCQEKGRTILSNTPCPAAPPSAVLKAPAPQPAVAPGIANADAGDYKTPFGTWLGQVQYQATTRGQLVPEAHTVVPLVLRIESSGKVTGVSTDNGCKLLGIATPAPYTPLLLQLDVTLSTCSFRDYNRRFTGNVVVDQQSRVANLSLNALGVGAMSAYNVKATMRR